MTETEWLDRDAKPVPRWVKEYRLSQKEWDAHNELLKALPVYVEQPANSTAFFIRTSSGLKWGQGGWSNHGPEREYAAVADACSDLPIAANALLGEPGQLGWKVPPEDYSKGAWMFDTPPQNNGVAMRYCETCGNYVRLAGATDAGEPCPVCELMKAAKALHDRFLDTETLKPSDFRPLLNAIARAESGKP